jgi:N6-L-threonylcarbamoyladenine synthase
MNILAIETSCDETAVSIVKFNDATYTILSNLVHTQIDMHKEYGGVFPTIAKREHAKNLPILIQEALEKSDLASDSFDLSADQKTNIREILEREPEAAEQLIKILPTLGKPAVDALAATYGPGLEPALWVGINVAKVLSIVWGVPLLPVNHMEGHILATLIKDDTSKEQQSIQDLQFPALALLISGGHTELVLVKDFGDYEKIGSTRDDAVGEAFDKVARLIGLPYPGGPEIERIALSSQSSTSSTQLPRPMIHTDDYDFSFSGLKTAVRNWVQEKETLTEAEKAALAFEFQQAVADVLIKKTSRAIENFDIRTLIISGGVSANNFIRESFEKKLKKDYPDVKLQLPQKKLSTDNALMMAFAGYFAWQRQQKNPDLNSIRAVGKLSL